MIRLVLLTACLLFLPVAAMAQNTGGVFPPTVNEGHKSLQYRVTVNPDNAQDEFGFAQRLHYQQAINGDLMWRVIGQTRKTSSSDFDFDFLQAELFWELTNNSDKHKSALRFDARLRDDNRPEQFGVNWTNQFNFSDGWSARAIVLSSVQTGGNAADGVNIQSRAQITKKLENGSSIGVELYNDYGRTGDIGNFDEQNHAVGPFISTPLTKSISIFAGPLIGLSGAAQDLEARLWITKGF